MSTERIYDIYRSILSYAGLHLDDNDHVYGQLNTNGKISEITVNDEPLVFPTKKHFNTVDQKKAYFNPLGENFMRAESEVNATLRHAIGVRLNYVTALTSVSLLNLLASAAKHRTLNEDQSELLKVISEADNTMVTNWSQLMARVIKGDPAGGFVKIYLKRSGNWRGKSYARVGVITFPFYQDLIAGKYDKGMRAKDRASFQKLMEFMFPSITDPEAYSYGTLTRVAPFLDALMQSTVSVASRLNDLNSIYEKHIDDADHLVFNMDWYSYFQNLDDLVGDISRLPDLRGNAGVATIQERKHPSVEQPVSPNRPEPVPQSHSHHHAPEPVASTATRETPARTTSEGKVNFAQALKDAPILAASGNLLQQQVPPEVVAYYHQYGQLPPGYQLPYGVTLPPPPHVPSWARPNMPPQRQAMGYGQSLGLPPPAPGYMWTPDANGQPIQVMVPPQQQQYVPPPQQQQWGQQPQQFYGQPPQQNWGAPPPQQWGQHPSGPPPGVPATLPGGWNWKV